MNRAWRELLEKTGVGALIFCGIVISLVVGYLVPKEPLLGVGLATVVLVGLVAIVKPVTLPLLAMPLIVVVHRASGGGVDLSWADVALGLAFWPAVLLGPRPFSPELRSLLWFNAIYQAATLFTVIANPFLANTIDWFHSWLLVSGALVVGWAVGRMGAGRLGIRLFLAAAIALALLGIVEGSLNYLSGNFEPLYPSWPWPMHKNYFGSLMCFAGLVFYARPSWMGLSRWGAQIGFWVCVMAMGVSQSRQALVGLAIGLVIIAFHGRRERRRGWLGLFLGVPALAVVATLVRDQVASGNEHNSFFQRLEWYDQSIANWESSPWFGLGLRYWTQGRAEFNFHPPQVFLEVMATAGIIGLIGFVVMALGMLRTVWGIKGVTGSLILGLLAARLVQGQLDIFWLSPTTSIPFLLIGALLGVLASNTFSDEVEPSVRRVEQPRVRV